jgi:hypothetical protein
VRVTQVKWGERIMSWNTTPYTDNSVWLNVNGINRFLSDFDPQRPVPLTVTVAGVVREMCPASGIFDSVGLVICEYALHGTQVRHQRTTRAPTPRQHPA